MSERQDKPHNQQPQALEDARLSALYAQTRAQSEPPRSLDAAILAQARRALESTPQSLNAADSTISQNTPRRLRRWSLPFSVAATLVISASLYLVTAPQPTLEPAVDGDPFHSRAFSDQAGETPEQKTEAAPVDSEISRQMESEPAVRAEPAQRLSQPSPPSAPAPASEAPLEQTPLQIDDRHLGGKQAQRKAQETLRSVQSDARLEKRADAPGNPALPDPARWLESIQTLLAAGERQAAVAELRRFRRHYPDYPLPARLQALTVK